jgi:uncharacterized protein (TIGR00730 family)
MGSIHLKSITVFGGSRLRPGQPAYEQAERLGRALGEAGFTVLTGGYLGTMEAVSKGAAEAGAHVIGVTCEQIEAWRPVDPNPWVQEEWRFATLRERLLALIDRGDAALALPGGVGTLTEIAMTWNQLLTDAIPPRPLILIGPDWRTVFDTFYQQLGDYVPADQRTWLHFAADEREVIRLLQSWDTD